MQNNPVMRQDPTGMLDLGPGGSNTEQTKPKRGIWGFFNKLGNWLCGNSWVHSDDWWQIKNPDGTFTAKVAPPIVLSEAVVTASAKKGLGKKDPGLTHYGPPTEHDLSKSNLDGGFNFVTNKLGFGQGLETRKGDGKTINIDDYLMNIVGGTGLNNVMDMMIKAVDLFSLINNLKEFEFSNSEISYRYEDSTWIETKYHIRWKHRSGEFYDPEVIDSSYIERTKRIKVQKKTKNQ